MKTNQPDDFRAAFAGFVEERASGAPVHATAEALAALRAAELEPAAAEAVRGHLLGCRECMERFRAPADFEPAPAADFEAAAFWRSLVPRIAALEAQRRGTAAPTAPRVRQPRQALLAASLAAVVGLGLVAAVERSVVLEQRRTIASLRQPTANAPIVDLAGEAMRSGGGPSFEAVAGAGFTLVLTPTEPAAAGSFELTIAAPGGIPEITVTGLTPNPADGTFSLWLPAGSLTPGEHRLSLRRLEPAGRVLVEEFRLDVLP